MFIDHKYIKAVLVESKNASDSDIEKALKRAEAFEGLTHHEVAMLLATEKPKYIERIYEIADLIKKQIYGKRIVMFAPLYVSDFCVNRCAYCSYNCQNQFDRQKLTMDEIRAEVSVLEAMGHKRIALEAGEHDEICPIDYILECIDTIYKMKFENGEIRRINVNIAATTVENYEKLKNAEIGTYILFQETYHKPTYEKVHMSGPKKDYAYHLTAFDRAMEAGIDDVGAGVLFGLYDPYFEVMGLMLHNEHLEEKFGVGFHTISVPRLCKAEGVDFSEYPLVDDATFKKVVAVIRLAVPFTGMILSTRENDEMRKVLLTLGISQLSAGSSTDVGGYSKNNHSRSQFIVSDNRGAASIISDLMEEGYIPSFCTACYRSGRTGDRFMRLAKSGQIKNVCLPNALMTLLEYVEDYGTENMKVQARTIVDNELENIKSDKVRLLTMDCIEKMQTGKRDLYL